MGFKNYIEGEWQVARRLLVRACEVLGSCDGPSESLLAFMHSTDFTAPEKWEGARELGPLLQGPPKSLASARTSTAPASRISGGYADAYDLAAAPSDDHGRPDPLATW